MPVVGVAKTRFASAGAAEEVLRGGSRRPLYVSAAGLDRQAAARHVQGMHGPFRLPTLLLRVDQLCRQATIPPTETTAVRPDSDSRWPRVQE